MTERRAPAVNLKDRLPPHVYRAYARLHLLAHYEALMRAFWPAITLIVLFVAIGVWGVFSYLPLPLHMAALLVFALALLRFLWLGGKRLRLPGQAELLARLERTSQLENAPLHSLADDLPPGATPEEASLWRVWQARLRGRIGHVRTGFPSIHLAPIDPFALRFIPALLLSAGLILFFEEVPDRLKAAFVLDLPQSQPLDVTAWAEPPEYTRLPVIYLTGTPDEVRVPEGARLRVQVNGSGTRLTLQDDGVETHLEPVAAEAADAEAYSAVIGKGVTAIRVMKGAETLSSWPVEVVPDLPPLISFTREPGFAVSGALQLSYEMKDDYGVTAAVARFATGAPLDPHVLVAPPEVNLVVPGSGAGAGRTFRDLSSSPWTGQPLELILEASDAAGQTGTSEVTTVTLPPRVFQNTFAREIVRLRQLLALDRRETASVGAGLIVVLNQMAAAEADVTAFTALSRAFWRLQLARDDDTRRDALDLMWQVALDLEGDAGALAAERLRDAQEDLREALRNNATPEEIAEKVEALKRAIAEFLASQPQMQMNAQQMQSMPNMEMRDISQMLQDMQSLAESGARQQAEQLLDNLEAMLQNLQTMQAMQQMQSPAMQALQALQDLMRQQQQLRDQTFRQGNQDELTPEQMQEALNELARQQNELAEMLRQMMQNMQMNPDPGQGNEPGDGSQTGDAQSPGQGQGPAQSLMEALRQMMQSRGQLGQGDMTGSGQSQGNALQSLREAGQQLLNMMAQQQPGQGPGTGFAPGAAPSANRDPLGRENGGFRQDGVEVPTATEAERVRDLLNQLRNRLSDPALDAADETYIERLLRY